MDLACTQCGAALPADVSPDESGVAAPGGLCLACSSYSPQATPAPLGDGAMLNFSISTLVSVCIHTMLLIGCALMTWGTLESDEGDDGFEVAIASLPTENLSDPRDETLDVEEATHVPASDETLQQIELTIDGPSAPIGELYADNVIGALAPSGSAGGGGTPQIKMITSGSALDGEATFMGLQAQGRRFCIIADRSGSMFGTKFEYVKEELLATIDGMRGHTRIQIVFFNTRALPYPKADWLSPRGERDAIKVWLDGLVADGDTFPTPAFVEAFAMEPLPDAIFFMTDGRFDARVVNQILRLNTVAQQKVPIHTITFVDRGAEAMMRKIAADSGGNYRHVSGAP